MKPPDDLRQTVGFRAGLPAGLTGDLSGPYWYQCALIRSYFFNQFQQTGPRISLNVVFDVRYATLQPACDLAHVLRLNVALISARVHRNARRARRDAGLDGLDNA